MDSFLQQIMENYYMSRHHSFVKINQAILEIEKTIKFSKFCEFQDVECVLVSLKNKLKNEELSESENMLTKMAIEAYVDNLDKNNYHLLITGDVFSALTLVETIFLKDSFKKMNPEIDVDFPAFSLDESFYKNIAIVAIPERIIDNNRLRKAV
jgi:hypothetical protein